VIPGKRSRPVTLRGFKSAGLGEFAHAPPYCGSPREDFLVRVSCRIKMDPVRPFTETRPEMTFRAQPFMKCE
jgi:hypothetical protein